MIKEFRKQMGWSQKKLSEITGIPRSTISQCERRAFKNSLQEKRLKNKIYAYMNSKQIIEKYKDSLNLIDEKVYQQCIEVAKVDVKSYGITEKSIWQKIKDWWLK